MHFEFNLFLHMGLFPDYPRKLANVITITSSILYIHLSNIPQTKKRESLPNYHIQHSSTDFSGHLRQALMQSCLSKNWVTKQLISWDFLSSHFPTFWISLIYQAATSETILHFSCHLDMAIALRISYFRTYSTFSSAKRAKGSKSVMTNVAPTDIVGKAVIFLKAHFLWSDSNIP